MSQASTIDAPDALFVDVPTAARMLSLGLTTVWTMVRTGELPHRRFRRAVRIPREAIERLARTEETAAS
jgi:excisionase family DNA binding protein